jgi:hypothetical protein
MLTLRWVRALGVGSFVAVVIAAHGCGVSSDGNCTDTATCTTNPANPPSDDGGGGGPGSPEGAAGEASSTDAPAADGESSDVGQSCDGCSLTATAGWSLVAFGASRAASCPAGFTPTDVIEKPVGTSATCSCGSCSITTAPNCTAVTISTMWDSGPAVCNFQGDYYQGAVSCGVLGGSFGLDIKAIPPTPVPGVCTAPSTADPSTVTAAEERVCVPTAACAACGSGIGADFAVCLASNGDNPCPMNAPTKHLVGTSPDVSCGTCGCSVSATCTGTLNFFTSGNCTGTSFLQVATDGGCHLANNQTVGSYTWTGSPVNPQCASGTSTATVALNGTQTICCP